MPTIPRLYSSSTQRKKALIYRPKTAKDKDMWVVLLTYSRIGFAKTRFCIAICCFERGDPQIVPKFSLSRFVHFKRGPEDILEEMLYASWFMFLILHMRRVPTSLEVDLRSTTKVGRFSYNLSIFLSSLCLHRHFWIYACFKAIARCLEHQYHLPAGEYLGFNVMYTMTNTKVIFSGNSCFNFFLKNCLHLNNQLKLTYNLLPGNSLT